MASNTWPQRAENVDFNAVSSVPIERMVFKKFFISNLRTLILAIAKYLACNCDGNHYVVYGWKLMNIIISGAEFQGRADEQCSRGLLAIARAN